eukprot:GDKI01019442.1.p1 GENE.GDKI01019442.1~~GDKI01019442.1.p1  ORF type:complete len:223 (+),score=48.55 GDKI01019442.1:77-670(+)
MNSKHCVSLFLLSLLCGFAAVNAAPQSLVDVLGTVPELGLLNRFMKQHASMLKLIETGDYTVFAPQTPAFAKLPRENILFLNKPENEALLKQVLMYTIVRGKYTLAQLKTRKSLKSLSGKTLTIVPEGDTVRVNGMKIVKSDVTASNGVLQVVDGMIVPREVVRKLPVKTMPVSISAPGSTAPALPTGGNRRNLLRE